jgi:hypothetical protein
MSDYARLMVPVFTVEVDRDDPHFIVVTRHHDGLAIANRFTLAGVTATLADLAMAQGRGALPVRDVWPAEPLS